MKIDSYFYLFLFITTFLAIVFFPTDTELIYVFEKSKNLPKLKEYYQKKLSKKYDNNTAFKYLIVLKELKDKSFFTEAEKFLKKYKNKKIIEDAINFSLAQKDFKKYVEWLNKGYNLTGDIKYLKKLLNYYSYIHDEKNFSNTLKKLYLITKNEKYLDILYGMGDEEFVINQYLKNEKLTLKNLDRILGFFINKMDYKNYIKYLEFAYLKTKNIEYLLKEKNFFSFIHDRDSLVKILKRLFNITYDERYLDELYDIGEKSYVISVYEKNFNNLNYQQKRKLLQYYIWENNTSKILSLLKFFIESGLSSVEDEKRYVNILSYHSHYNELINYYKFKFKKTKNLKYLKNLADIYNYYGYPEKACKVYFKLFKLTHEKEFLDLIIDIYSSLNDYQNFLKFNLIKLENFYSEKLLRQIVGFLIENNNLKKALKLTEKFYKKDRNLLHFLITLYFINNEYNRALNLMLSTPPEQLNNNELNFIATYTPFDEKFIPYIERYYAITKNRYFIEKILKFYAKNMAFYKFNRFFKKYFGKINENNFNLYFELIPKKFKKFKRNEAFRLALASFNVKLLNNLGIYLMGLGEQKKSEKIFKKVLFLDDKNLMALEHLGKLYYWQNDYTNALRLFLKYDRLNPKNPVIKFYLGEIYWNKKKFKLAKKYFHFVVKNIKKDTLEKHMIYLKSYVFLYGIDDVIDEYREVVKKSGFNKDVYADFIDALYFSKKFKILKDEYKKFKKMPAKYTNYVRLLRLFAMFNIEIKNFKDAYFLLKKAYSILLKNGSVNSTILADFGYFYISKGDRITALKYYKKAYNINRKNKELKEIVKKLEDEFSKNVVIKYEYKNKVKIAGFDINYPYKEKIWIGIGYRIFEYDISEIYFKIQDINKIFYNFEAGKNHFKIEFGNNYKLFLDHSIFPDYTSAIDEKMTETRVGFSISKNIKKFSFYVNSSKNFYRNEHGRVAETVSFELSTSYSINSLSYLTAGFSYVKLNSYKELRSDVFFDDYRAVNLFYSKDYLFKNDNIKFHLSAGGIYDLISEKLNYSFDINFIYKNSFIAEYNLYYDTFSKEQVDMLKLNFRIRF